MGSRRAAEKSEESPAPMQEIVAAGAALLVVDEKGNVLQASGWEEMLGGPAPQSIPDGEGGAAELFEMMAAAAQESRRSGAAVRRYIGVSLERHRTYAIFAGPMRGAIRPAAVAILASEITDAFKAGPQEGEAIRQLGHDLRTPLTSMSGAVEILQMGRLGALVPQQAKLVDMVQQGIDLMLSLIERATTPYRVAATGGSGPNPGTVPGDGILR